MRHILDNQPRDEDDRIVIRMGGDCPVCGNEAVIKYSGNGAVVLYHLPVECRGHLANWKREFQAKKQREIDEGAA